MRALCSVIPGAKIRFKQAYHLNLVWVSNFNTCSQHSHLFLWFFWILDAFRKGPGNFSKKGGTREWCLVKPTLASPIFFLRWVNTDEHEFYSEHFSQEFPYLSAIRGTRPPSPREVNSRGSSSAVGRFAPSGLPSLFPRLIEMIQIDTVATLQTDFLSNTVIASEAKQSSSYQEIASSLRSSQ